MFVFILFNNQIPHDFICYVLCITSCGGYVQLTMWYVVVVLLPHVFLALIGNFGLGLVNLNNGLLIKSLTLENQIFSF